MDASANQYEDQPDLEAAYEDILCSIDPNSGYFQKLESMNKIEKIVHGLGWLDKLTEQASIIKKAFQPSENQSGSQWAALVQTARKAILALKAKYILLSQENGKTNNDYIDQVAISDMSYIGRHTSRPSKKQVKNL